MLTVYKRDGEREYTAAAKNGTEHMAGRREDSQKRVLSVRGLDLG